MRNLMVTGGCGFIGANFIRYLLTDSDFDGRIFNLDNLTYAGNIENLTDIERQLSTRKPAGNYLPDGSKGNSATTPDNDTQKQEDVKP